MCMLKNVPANIFYTCIRYRLLSHVTRGETKRAYKKKYHQLKEVIKQFSTERIYLLGIKVLTVRDCGTLRCHFIFGIPVWTQLFHETSYTCRLFGINVYKKKFSAGKNALQWPDEFQGNSSVDSSSDIKAGMTSTEKNIYSLLEAMHSREV